MRVKVCINCKEELPLTSFHKAANNKYGVQSSCKTCRNGRRREYYKEVKEDYLQKCKEYRDSHKPERKVYKRKYDKDNRDKCNKYASDRRARMKGATLHPQYNEEILIIYKKASDKGLHVDHIVPLAGDDICGLHVPWNLQILTPQENLTKSNKWSCE